jgi:hypothetical protein
MIRWVLGRAIEKAERERKHASQICDMIDASPRAAWLVIRVTLLLAALIWGGGLAGPAAAQVSDPPPAVPVYTLTPERIAASTATGE